MGEEDVPVGVERLGEVAVEARALEHGAVPADEVELAGLRVGLAAAVHPAHEAAGAAGDEDHVARVHRARGEGMRQQVVAAVEGAALRLDLPVAVPVPAPRRAVEPEAGGHEVPLLREALGRELAALALHEPEEVGGGARDVALEARVGVAGINQVHDNRVRRILGLDPARVEVEDPVALLRLELAVVEEGAVPALAEAGGGGGEGLVPAGEVHRVLRAPGRVERVEGSVLVL